MLVMLNPSVGLMVLMSSPLMRFTTVVLPALSRPLQGWVGGWAGETCVDASRRGRAALPGGPDVHHEDAHLPLLGLHLLQNAEQPHGAQTKGGEATDRQALTPQCPSQHVPPTHGAAS
jgi:hypothetical protein